jgi:hypothetical protein
MLHSMYTIQDLFLCFASIFYKKMFWVKRITYALSIVNMSIELIKNWYYIKKLDDFSAVG